MRGAERIQFNGTVNITSEDGRSGVDILRPNQTTSWVLSEWEREGSNRVYKRPTRISNQRLKSVLFGEPNERSPRIPQLARPFLIACYPQKDAR